MNAHKGRTCLAIISLLCLLPSLGRGQTVPAGATEEATRIIDAWKAKAETDPAWFRHKWAMTDSETDFSAAALEDPYVLYMMPLDHFVGYLDSKDPDILSSAQLFCYGFPIVNKGRFIGSLMIIKNRDSEGKKYIEQFGEYAKYGGHPADVVMDQRIRELQAMFSKGERYVVCGLQIADHGAFVLVRRGERTEFITACDLLSGKTLGLEEGREKRRFPVIPFDKAVPPLRQSAEGARAWLESPAAERMRDYNKSRRPDGQN